ncbi:hypothetical protein N1851_018451 [Merluccius polli]|uniref:C2H2-type domain-containing protein n=1 Tax=Merluccius polli TaxID=89951 RepID=A0AA47MN86_MERPO|nr:hypothetical protein N1851_018451 [Merluccius polli]
MTWHCMLCSAHFSTRTHLFKHCRLQHSHFSRVSPLPCLHDDCMCTFQTLSAQGTHLSRYQTPKYSSSAGQSQRPVTFKCPSCTFQQLFSESVLSHIRTHLKKHETVLCPYKGCNYSINMYSSFNSHKSRAHQGSLLSDFQNDVLEHTQNLETTSCDVINDVYRGGLGTKIGPITSPSLDVYEECRGHSTETDDDDDDEHCDTFKLKKQLKLNVASLFLKMQVILHMSNTATQEIVDHLNQIFCLSQPLIKEAVNEILQRYGHNITDSILNQVVIAIMDSNVVFSATSKGAELSATKRRKTFIEHNYPLVMPVEYHLEQPGPILNMIQELFKNTDILSKIREPNTEPGQYLFSTEDLNLAIQLYIDELEIANPHGTSHKVYKLCAVYWVLANLPPKYRSAMHTIQLAVLAKVTDVKKYGYAAIQYLLHCCVMFALLNRMNVKGTIVCVSADNLAAHGLGGFLESFRAEYACRFCMATSEQFQATEVKEEEFVQRTKASHDVHVQNVLKNGSEFGVKGDCVLRKALHYFHPITGFPPDILHDLLEDDSTEVLQFGVFEPIASDSMSSPERLSRWPPGSFPIPTFGFDVELTLREGNAEFEKTGRPVKSARDQKHDILEKLASTIYGFKAYPSDKEIAVVAEALVAKHPCLKKQDLLLDGMAGRTASSSKWAITGQR